MKKQREILPSFEDPKAAERRETQYFEMFGNRGIYHKGWTAVTRHRTPWLMTEAALPFDDDIWELYDTNKDWSQTHDLAKQMPEKLHDLQRLWLIEATRNNVLPMDDRMAERVNSDMAGRPVLIRGTSQALAMGMGGLNENGVVNVKNKSHSVTAQLLVPEGKPANGVIISQGGIRSLRRRSRWRTERTKSAWSLRTMAVGSRRAERSPCYRWKGRRNWTSRADNSHGLFSRRNVRCRH